MRKVKMLQLLIFSVLVSVSTQTRHEHDEDKKPMYSIAAPSSITSRAYYTVEVFIHNAPKPVDIIVDMEKPEGAEGHIHTFEPLSSTIRPGDGKSFRFKTKLLSSDSYTLRVKGSKGIDFEDSVVIPVNAKKATTLIQTDKGLYQAGQTVKFRIIVLDTLLLPLETQLQVEAYDGNGNLVKQWNEKSSSKGVFSSNLSLSETPVLGDWTLKVHYDNDLVAASQQFRVEEYVLPTYLVTIRTQPTYVTFNDSDVLVIVEASYPHGQEVKGKVSLHIRDEYCELSIAEKCDAKMFVSAKTKFVGEAQIKVNFVNDLTLPYSIYGFGFRNFKIEAVVIEDMTQLERNASVIVAMHKDPFKVELIPSGSFKPGLPFTQLIKVTYHDDSPIIKGDGEVQVTVQFTSENKNSEKHSLPMTPSGIIKLDINVPVKATTLNFQASYKDVTGFATVPKAASMGNFEYIKLKQISDIVEIDKPLVLEIESTGKLDSRLILLVVARGDINYVKVFSPSDKKTQTVEFSVHEAMSPLMTVLVYYVTTCGNLVVDAISVQVQGSFKTPVSLKLNHNNTEPGKEIKFEVKSKPKTFVGILAVDKLAMRPGNDITEQRVLDDLAQYEKSRQYFYNPLLINKKMAFPHPWSNAINPLQIFRDGGLIIKTNFLEDLDNLAGPIAGDDMARYKVFNVPRRAPSGIGRSADQNYVEPDRESDRDDSENEVASKERKNFPETLLWLDSEIGPSGKLLIHKTVPDSMTSYVVSAIVVNEKTGFGLAYPASFSVSKLYFSTINAPYSIVRGETVTIQALTYNNYKHPVKGTVTLKNEKHEFFFVDDHDKEIDDASKAVHINIPEDDGLATNFKIKPKNVGYIDLKVTTIGHYGVDSLVKTVIVKAEGIERTVNKAFLVDLTGMGQEFHESVKIEIPAEAVPDSEKITVSVIGNVLGPSVANYNKLVGLPEGSGEQNMVNLAPDIAIANLLRNLGSIDQVKANLTEFMEKGYQTELTYKRKDGGFSAFGNRDAEGSTWLTAFVVKSFTRAEKFIAIDKNVVENAVDFLRGKQQPDGSFKGDGSTTGHHILQSGASQGMALTAYTLIALKEANNSQCEDAIRKATEHLEGKLSNLKDAGMYEVILATYALHLVESPKKDDFLAAVKAKAVTQDGKTHWDIAEDPQKPVISKALSIESTAYVLLTLIKRNDVEGSIPVIKWLSAQQNQNGGFESTQDTVVGIEALAAAGEKLVNKPNSNLKISVKSDDETHDLTVDSSNMMVLQKLILPAKTKEVTISATGNGIAVAQVTYSYNDKDVHKDPDASFSATVKSTMHEINNRSYDLQVCTKKEHDDSTNMIVMEIGMASGSIVDKDLLPAPAKGNEPNSIKKVESKDSNTRVVLYFDAITEVCVNVTAAQTNLVFNSKPALVKVYNYYEPDKRGEILYNAPDIK